jgi:hypothetical protein
VKESPVEHAKTEEESIEWSKRTRKFDSQSGLRKGNGDVNDFKEILTIFFLDAEMALAIEKILSNFFLSGCLIIEMQRLQHLQTARLRRAGA